MDLLVQTQAVTKTYVLGKTEVHALRGLTLDIEAREFTAISGPSGSGSRSTA